MKNSRVPGRLLIFALLLPRLLFGWLRRKPEPAQVRRILVLHQFLLGDALLATSLLAKLRQQYPTAEMVLACPPLHASLYANHPYGVTALAWQPRDFASIRRLFALPRFDLVLLVGENRLGYLARALGGRWIVGFAGEQPAYKNWLVDEKVAYSTEPTAWADTAAELLPGPPPRPFDIADWPILGVAPMSLPARYAVLHVGASSASKCWAPANWQQLAHWLRQQQIGVVWSCGPGESALLDAIAIDSHDQVMAGNLDLPQLRAVLAGACVAVCPDTGVAHLAKTAGTPLVMLFGPGSAAIFGASRFFSRYPCIAVGPEWFPCRNDRSVHHRPVDWALRCDRRIGAEPGKCKQALCMAVIDVRDVIIAVEKLLEKA